MSRKAGGRHKAYNCPGVFMFVQSSVFQRPERYQRVIKELKSIKLKSSLAVAYQKTARQTASQLIITIMKQNRIQT